MDVGGSRLVGFIARPPRGEAPIGKNGRSIVVNLGRPRALLVAIREAHYDPIMQAPYDAAMLRAVNRIPQLMQDELDDAIAYRDSRPGMRRIGP